MTSRHKGWIAGFVCIAGVAIIWAANAYHQNQRTRELHGHFLARQWAAARECIVGTPERGQSEDEVANLLRMKLRLALLDRAQRWPERCTSSVHDLDAGESGAESEIHALQEQLPRVLATDAGAEVRLAELAPLIVRIDSALPR
jgi:hypothetical protein